MTRVSGIETCKDGNKETITDFSFYVMQIWQKKDYRSTREVSYSCLLSIQSTLALDREAIRNSDQPTGSWLLRITSNLMHMVEKI